MSQKHVVHMWPSWRGPPLSALFDSALLLAGGMCGYLLPAEGDPCPTVVPTPFGTLGDDIGANATCSAFYANPRHQKHVSRPLEGQGFEVMSPMHFALCREALRSCRTSPLP